MNKKTKQMYSSLFKYKKIKLMINARNIIMDCGMATYVALIETFNRSNIYMIVFFHFTQPLNNPTI